MPDPIRYANMDHTGQYRGYAPDLDPDFSYPVFMAATAGDGSSIQRAINAGTNGATRHSQWLASQPRVRPCRSMICVEIRLLT